MKKKQFMSKLAALTMAAAMGLTAVPSTVFAANTAEISADDAQTTNQTDMQKDVSAALDFIVSSAYNTDPSKPTSALGVNSTRADIETAIEYALKNGKGPTPSSLTNKTSYTAAILGDITKGDIDTTAATPVQAFKFNLQVKYTPAGGSAEIHNYAVNLDIPVNYTDFSSAQKVDAIGAALKKAAEAVNIFSATGEPDATLVKTALQTAYSGLDEDLTKTAGASTANITYSYTVNNVAGGSTESTTTTKGAVTGTITVKAPAVTAASGRAAQDAVSKDFTYSAARPFSTASLTNTKLDDVVEVVKGTKSGLTGDNAAFNTHVFANDVTSEEIATFANKYIQAMSATDTSWQGITATVGGLTQVEKQTHDASADGSFAATVTLTDGTNTLARAFTGKLAHADSEKLSEMDAALTKAASDYKITKLQSANQTKPAAEKASPSGAVSVETTIKDIIASAIDSKPETTNALSTDGWIKTGKVYGYGASGDTANAKVSRDAINISFNSTSDTSYSTGSDKKADAAYMAPNEIDASVTYTRATAEKEGKIEAVVTYAVADDSGDTTSVVADDDSTKVNAKKTATKTTTFTLTVPKLKAKADTYLRFKDDSKTWVYNSTYPQNVNVPDTDENADNDNTYKFDLDTDLIRNGNDELVWTSSNPNSVIVDQNGVVTLKGVGEATITVASKSNPSLTDSIVVNSDNTYIFKDVQDSSKYYFDPVYWAARHKITAGTSKDTFGVGENLTRAQMITFLWVAAGKPTVSTTSDFTDVPEGAFYEDAVNWAAAEGITAGTTPTTFSPDQTLTRAQAVTFLYKVYGNGEKYTATKSSNFSDVSENIFYFNAVNWAVKNGITAGKTATKFAPDDECTREQGITFLYKTVGPNMPYANSNLR